MAGERPLWDFPDGTLAGREISAFLVSEATGWRSCRRRCCARGRSGPGMVQLWIDGDEDVDLPAFVRRDDPALRRMAVFDAVVNNADRKGGHIIPTPGGHVYGVDHGICFSVDPKLRTLLWRWAGQAAARRGASRCWSGSGDELRGDLGEELHEHLTRREVRTTQQRVAELLRTGRHPDPAASGPPCPGRPSEAPCPSCLARALHGPSCAIPCRTEVDCPSSCSTCHPSTMPPAAPSGPGRPAGRATPDATDADWASLGSFADGFHVEIQRTGSGTPPRWHVDIETDDIQAEVARLEALGARRHRYGAGNFWQLLDPAGLVFCVVGIQTGGSSSATP